MAQRNNVLQISCAAAFLAASFSNASAQAPNPTWISELGPWAAEALAADTSGAVFVGGLQQGGGYLARLDTAGNELWRTSTGAMRTTALAPDGAGGVFLVNRIATMGPAHARVQRFNPSGGLLWTAPLLPYDLLGDVISDGSGGAFSVGSRPTGPSGAFNAIVVRFSNAGALLWLRELGTASTNNDMTGASGITPDGTGGVFITGWTLAHLGGGGTWPTFDEHAFIARYSESGQRLWVDQFGVPNQILGGRSVVPDGEGGAFLVGTILSSSWNILLARYDAAGNRLWMAVDGTAHRDFANAAISDGRGGFIVVGDTRGNFGGPLSGTGDAFVARYDQTGARSWVRQFGTPDVDEAHAIAPAPVGGFYIAGRTRGTFNPPAPVGSDQGFVARFPFSSCYANCDGSTIQPILNVDDFTCFISEFASAQTLPHEQQLTHYANCDGSTVAPVLNVDDFTCFINAFAQGCP